VSAAWTFLEARPRPTPTGTPIADFVGYGDESGKQDDAQSLVLRTASLWVPINAGVGSTKHGTKRFTRLGSNFPLQRI
jgi:hypothetical protein